MSRLSLSRRHLVTGLLLAATLGSSASAQPGLLRPVVPVVDAGLIVLAEQRFNPLVQRLMAEQSLRALPLYGGQLFYLVPVAADRGNEEMQIRYLEVLLRERGQREGEASDLEE